MTTLRFNKCRFTFSFITLLLTLQITACGTEELATAISPDIGSSPATEISSSSNRAAVISGVDTGSVIEDVDPNNNNMLEVSGKLNITDIDEGEAAFIAETISGTYGSLETHTDGVWNYTASNNQSTIQNLTGNETLTDTLTVRSIDGTTHTVEITIIGVIDSNAGSGSTPNTPAVISGASTGSVTEDIDPNNNNLLEVSGALNITDPDVGEAAFIATTYNGSYGGLTITAAGNWSYAASNNLPAIQNLSSGSTLTDNLIVSSLDGTTKTVRITIAGADEANSPAIISGVSSGNVTEDVDPNNNNLLEVGAKLNISDSDAGEAAFTAKTVNGNYGSLTIDAAGNWNYSANNNQSAIQNLNTGSSITDNLTISSIDGTSRTITVTIFGANETSPSDITISWTAPAQREDNSGLSLSAIASYKIYYGTAQGQYPSSATINDNSATSYIFNNLSSSTYYFVVTTIDTDGRESQYSTEVIISI